MKQAPRRDPAPPDTFLPGDARTHTFLIYDNESGHLVHGHREVVLPYGEAPGTEQIMKRALELAVEVTGREPRSLRALEVSEDELTPGIAYKVDLKTRRLEPFDADAARDQ